jgi:hypothetical protein
VTVVHGLSSAEFDVRNVGAEAYRRWALAFWVLSAAAAGGLLWTARRLDNHPVVFTVSSTWFLGLLAGMLTRRTFLSMDPRVFALARWERDGRIYERVGVGASGWLLRHTPLGWVDPFLKVRAGSSDMDRLLRELSFAEGTHLIQGAASLSLAVAFLASGHAPVGLACMILSVPFHVYPIMLQRRSRGRVLRVIARGARRRPTRG